MNSMQAIEITKSGGPEVLSFGEIPLPTPTGQQIRVEVRATALNQLKQWFKKYVQRVQKAPELDSLMETWGRSGHIDILP